MNDSAGAADGESRTTSGPGRRFRHRLRRILAVVLVAFLALGTLTGIAFGVSAVPSILLLRLAFVDHDVVLPYGFSETKSRVVVHHDLTYPSSSHRNDFDLYLPKTAGDKRLPVIVWVHGGGFITGDKSGVSTYATLLADQGYAVVAMNYAYAPDAVYPTPVVQLGEMVKHVADIADEYGLDADRILLGGDSAGAQIAAQFAALETTPGYRTLTGISVPTMASPIEGLILFCGPYDLESSAKKDDSAIERWFISTIGWGYLGRRDWRSSAELKQASIVNHLSADFPPTYVTDGNYVSFPEQGRKLVSRLTKLGVRVESSFFPDAPKLPHEFQFNFEYPQSSTVWKGVKGFLDGLDS